MKQNFRVFNVPIWKQTSCQNRCSMVQKNLESMKHLSFESRFNIEIIQLHLYQNDYFYVCKQIPSDTDI